MGKEILPLICPDWRNATLVIDGTDASVAFANSTCIEMLRRERQIRLARGRLVFGSPQMDRRFHSELARMISTGCESAFLVEHDMASDIWLSVGIRNGQGFYRDAIQIGLGAAYASKLMVVEFFDHSQGIDGLALAAFAATASLTRAEAQLVDAIAIGISLQQAAKSRDVAISTIRQRMKAILLKTGCRTQSELIHLILSLCPRRSN